jgi:hypothetical protein
MGLHDVAQGFDPGLRLRAEEQPLLVKVAQRGVDLQEHVRGRSLMRRTAA